MSATVVADVRLVLLLLMTSFAASGCLEPGGPQPYAADADGEGIPATPPQPAHLVEYEWTVVLFGTDGVGAGDLCRTLPRADKWYLPREDGPAVDATHRELVIRFETDDVFTDLDYTGYRVGAYYHNEPVFWTPLWKDGAEMAYPLDGTMVDVDEHESWSFFYKRTDPLNEGDEDACTAGNQSGTFHIDVLAR